MWESRSFDSAKVSTYFQEWRPRFWLFHPKHPFLQCLADDLGNPVPVTLLNMAVASTGDATLFDHSLDAAKPGFTFAETSRQLMAFLTFKTGGYVEGVTGDRTMASAIGAPWADGAAFLSQGQNLFRTLLLNLMLPDIRKEIVRTLGVPEWERSQPSPRTPPPQGARAGPPPSYLEFLTVPCRQVLLSDPDSIGLVRHVRLQLGCIFTVEAPIDPAKAYTADKKRGLRPIGLQAGRSLWRDSATLLKLSSEAHTQPGTLAQIHYLTEKEILPDDLVVGLRAFGTIGNRAKLDLWRAETLPIPVSVLGNTERRVLIENCLSLAEDVEKVLSAAGWVLVRRLVAESREERDRKALRDHLDVSRPFWTALETPFKRDVLGASESVDNEKIRCAWAEGCIDLAREVLAKALNGLVASGKTLQGGAEAERTLSYRLRDVRVKHNLS
jgi:CRISPR system Cascade subunit CasA